MVRKSQPQFLEKLRKLRLRQKSGSLIKKTCTGLEQTCKPYRLGLVGYAAKCIICKYQWILLLIIMIVIIIAWMQISRVHRIQAQAFLEINT